MKNLFKILILLSVFIAPNFAQAQTRNSTRNQPRVKTINSPDLNRKCKSHLRKVRRMKSRTSLTSICPVQIGKTADEDYGNLQPLFLRIKEVYKMLLKIIFLVAIFATIYYSVKSFWEAEGKIDWKKYLFIAIALLIAMLAGVVIDYMIVGRTGLHDYNSSGSKSTYIDCRKPTILYKKCNESNDNAVIINKKYLLRINGDSTEKPVKRKKRGTLF